MAERKRKKDDRTMGERGASNQVRGAAKEVEGHVRSGLGGLTNNRSEQLKGEAKKVEGKAQRGVGRGQEKLDRNT
jgi:uncharacterized protein YjbJ (UPF0337 family)